MIRNFQELKEQLKALSEVVNGFKSEAVQLRIVEHVLGLPPEAEESLNNIPTQGKVKPAKEKGRKKPEKPKTPKKSAKKPSGQGAVATLVKLVEDDFFKTPKSIGDIVEYCDHHLARKFKANEFSGKLGRLVREGTLTRDKNKENQYEYQNK